MYFLRDSLSPSPSSLGATLKGKNLLPKKEFAPLGSKFFPLRVPQIRSNTVSTIKVKSKNIFF